MSEPFTFTVDSFPPDHAVSGATESDADADAADREAITAFQEAKGLETTGELNDATKAALEEAHGS